MTQNDTHKYRNQLMKFALFSNVIGLPDAKCDKEPGFNNEVYNYMWGPTEFNISGTLVDFYRFGDLDKITEPILFMTGV